MNKKTKRKEKKENSISDKGSKGTLFIDTTDSQKVLFAFAPIDESREILSNEFLLQKGTGQTSEFLKKFLKISVNNDLDKVISIIVATGHGSFAGIRSAVALALGIGLAKGIPVYASNGGSKYILITEKSEIDYGAAPNIGVAKKKILKQIK
jgi:hypothetical protein